ncbi:hypothetical protein [Mangrovihabitans endophyticus]|uniref:Secreted protein n=1 Tax=Mangrovihabitans endophyticus TaxID=1751298 RepID=A0A8J3BW15_9ACTN|nr:hypothetical protein [Mangrovihabitans endophyticus]GGK81735.1 hypothetical protein GCM10012284_14720 [Mangrovihabitans endophyticus]
MRRNVARLAVIGALATGVIGAVAAPALAEQPWTRHGFYPTYAACSMDGSLAVRGPDWSEYSCTYEGVNGYELWLR